MRTINVYLVQFVQLLNMGCSVYNLFVCNAMCIMYVMCIQLMCM